jgi:SAM-dependent methyltransferase
VARNWDEHYQSESALDFTPSGLLVQVAEMLPPGRALDLASGAGRNALYLAELGWQVVAVDSSPAGMRVLRQRAAGAQLSVHTHVADLEDGGFAIEPAGYDLICDFFYLQRDLFPQIRDGIRPGGMFVAEIHLPHDNGHRYVLEPGELRGEFAGWKILYYSEALPAGHSRPRAAIIARRA